MIDLDQADGGTHYSADLLILGGGIAGLTLANALLDSGLQIAVLEGGGLTLEERSQEIYNVEMAGHPHKGVTQGRWRVFGGSSTRWGGQLLPYPQDVFDPPQSAGMEEWIVKSSELTPFYPAVLRNFGIPEEPFLSDALVPKETPAGGEDIQLRYSGWASFTQRNVAATLGKRCSVSQNIAVYYHANVTRLVPNSAGDVISQVQASSYNGKSFTFSAPCVVITLGSIESSRLLLASGLGGDQVGRYFHDHIAVSACVMESPAREAAIKLFAPRVEGQTLHTPKLEATAKWREKNSGQAVMSNFLITEPDDSPFGTVRLLLQMIQRKQMPPGLLPRLAKLPIGAIELLTMAYSTRVSKRRAISKRAEFLLTVEVEQHPLAESRVTLSDSKDPFGMPRARLDWKISEREARTVRLFAKRVQAVLEAMKIGPIKMHPSLECEDDSWLSIATDNLHMMGGTRMGSNKATSVVDGNLKVHGVENLYVASCSTYPSGGSSNPTFTLMSLTLRLAELLRNRLGKA